MLLQGINEVTHERDYTTLLWLGREDEEASFQRRILQNRLMDGLVIASINSDDPLIEALLEKQIPFVMVERPARHAEHISYVVTDNVLAAKEAVSHLIAGGRKRIATITGKLAHVDGQDRLEGYKQALAEAKLTFDPELVIEGDFSFRSGYDGAKKLLGNNIDAVFAATDRCAMGVLQALQEAQLEVPADIALVGFDNLADPLMHSNLLLTTVQHHIAKRAGLATEVLIDLIEGKKSGPQHLVLPAELIVRQSSSQTD
jgi:DNA-binding LacI/PurR family transcriptional regulator